MRFGIITISADYNEANFLPNKPVAS